MSESPYSHSTTDVFNAALALPPEARAELADILLDRIESPPSTDIEAAWAKEIQRRVAAYEQDPNTAIPGEQVLAEMRYAGEARDKAQAEDACRSTE